MSGQKRVDGFIAGRIDEQITAGRGENLYYVDRDRSLKFTQGT
jgi:hypothetical protein